MNSENMSLDQVGASLLSLEDNAQIYAALITNELPGERS